MCPSELYCGHSATLILCLLGVSGDNAHELRSVLPAVSKTFRVAQNDIKTSIQFCVAVCNRKLAFVTDP